MRLWANELAILMPDWHVTCRSKAPSDDGGIDRFIHLIPPLETKNLIRPFNVTVTPIKNEKASVNTFEIVILGANARPLFTERVPMKPVTPFSKSDTLRCLAGGDYALCVGIKISNKKHSVWKWAYKNRGSIDFCLSGEKRVRDALCSSLVFWP